MTDSHTDCRSEIGITVGLIDGLISIARVLAKRDLSDPATREALSDLRQDEDVSSVMGLDKAKASSSPSSSPSS